MAKTYLDESRHGLGVLLILLSAFSFSCMSLFVAKSQGIHLFEQTFFRNLIGLLIAGCYCIKNQIPLFGERKYQPQMFARSLFGFLAVVTIFYSSREAKLADMAIVLRTGMFTISIVSVLFLGEKLTRMHIPAMLIAFTGAWIAANPHFDSSVLPLLAAFVSALCDTVCYPMLSYFSGRVNPMSVVMHFCTVSTVLAGFLMIPYFTVPTAAEWFYLIMIGISAALGQITMTYAYKMAAAGELSVYNQSQIVFNAILAFLFLHQAISARTVVGGFLVLFASFLLYLSKRRKTV